MTRSPPELSVRDIVDRAGTSVGAFYSRFEDRDVALDYAHYRFWEQIEERWDALLQPAAWQDVPARRISATIIRALVRSWLSDAARLRGFLRFAATSGDPVIRRRLAALDQSIARRFGTLLAGAPSGAEAEDAAVRAEESFRLVLSALRESVLLGPDVPPRSAEARDLVLLVARSFFRAAGLEPPPRTYEELLRDCIRAPLPRVR